MRKSLILAFSILWLASIFGIAIGSGGGVKNNGTKPMLIGTASDNKGEDVFGLYVMPGETLVFDDRGEYPISGAGYYQSMPGKLIQVVSKRRGIFLENIEVFCLRVKKISWDRKGRLTAIVGLKPLVEGANGNIVITSDVKKPRVADGKLYFSLKDHLNTEYWVETSFGKFIVNAGKQPLNQQSAK
jgi:hypothetical protein